MKIEAVIFDMDGLLLDTEKLYLAGYRTTRSALGLPPDDQPFMNMIGLNGASSQVAMQTHFGPQAERFWTQWRDEVRHLFSGSLPVKSGVLELLGHLQSIAMPYAIATSTQTDSALAHLGKADLRDHFTTVIGGDQVRNGKPAPDIYLMATEKLGVDPARSVAFEDSENGVRAALAAGLTTVQVPDIKAPDDAFRALGHHIAPNLLDGARMVGILAH